MLLFVPIFMPFFFHWYTGDDPPLAGIAENVTGELSHNVEDEVVITNAGVKGSATVNIAVAL